MEALSYLHSIHIEYVITILSAVVIYLRLAPLAGNLKVLLYAAQAGLLIAQMYAAYKKDQKEKKLDPATPKHFVAEIADHYLKTHPEGRKIAKETEIDDDIKEIIHSGVG